MPSGLKILTMCICFFGLMKLSYGQDSSAVIDAVKKYTSVSGGVSAQTLGYHATGIDSRRDPFYWAVQGNLTLKVAQWTLPFTVVFNQQEAKFNRPQPFNQFGVSPKYKWVTAHLGYRYMRFSDYTLSGNMFLGAGIELAPQKSFVEFRAMYGRFAKATESSNNAFLNASPTFDRWGYSAKTTFKFLNQELDLILFKAQDDLTSLSGVLVDSLGLAPAENLVTGINFRGKLSDKTQLNFEYAISAYTLDTRPEEVVLNSYTYLNNLGGLYVPRPGTQINRAFKSTLSHQTDKFQVDLSYRQIDPEYKTMGSTFLNNDLRDVTGGLGVPLWQNKLNANVNVGFQRNNLDENKVQEMTRVIWGSNVTIAPSDKISFNINYANYTTNTTQRVFQQQTDDLIDSIYYLQVTNNAGLSGLYNLPWEKVRSTINLNTSYQGAKDNGDSGSEFYLVNLGAQFQFPTSGIQLSPVFNWTKNRTSFSDRTQAGPTVAIAKTFWKKITSSLSAAWQWVDEGQGSTSSILSTSLRLGYTWKEKHTFAINSNYLARNSDSPDVPAFSEIRAGLNYNYRF